MTTPDLSQFIHFNPTWYQKLNNNMARVRNTVCSANIAEINTGHKIKIAPNPHQFMAKLSPFQRTIISQKIASLSPTPRPRDASAQKDAHDIFSFVEAKTGFSISYKVHGCSVYILEIVPNPKLIGMCRELPALYEATKENGAWVESDQPVTEINTLHAAINGQSNDLEKSVELMGQHLCTTFQQDNISQYTLYHNPTDGQFWDTYESSLDKKQQTTAVASQFSNVLAGVEAKGQPVKWLAHSQGGLIFTEGARKHWETHHTALSMNSVQFNAGANNETTSIPILNRVNIDILGFNNHPFDPVPNLIGCNAKDWVSVLGSVLGFCFIFSDNPKKSPHTLPYTGNSSVVNKVYDIKDKSALIVQSIINALPK